MQIIVFGTGGIGGFLAGKIGPLQGRSVSLVDGLSIVARGEHLEAIQANGLVYRDPQGEERRIYPSLATDDPGRLPVADLIFICVKGYDLDDAVAKIDHAVRGHTIVIPLLNGADIYDRVREKLSRGIVLPGAIYISSSISEPGVVSHSGGKGLVITGAEPERSMEKPDNLISLFEQAEIPYEWHQDPLPAVWEKYVFISPFGMVTAVAGKSIGEVLADSQLNRDVREMVNEAVRVAEASGVTLPENIVEQTMKKAESFPPDTKTSFQRDIEKHKPQDERELFGATVIRLAGKHGVETPVTEQYHGALP